MRKGIPEYTFVMMALSVVMFFIYRNNFNLTWVTWLVAFFYACSIILYFVFLFETKDSTPQSSSVLDDAFNDTTEVLENKDGEFTEHLQSVIGYKKHSRFYYWWSGKKELWWMVRKGKFFIEKSFIGEQKECTASWYYNQHGKQFVWELKPTTHYGLISGYLFVKLFRKKEKHGAEYSLITIGDYSFIEHVANGTVEELSKDVAGQSKN